MLCPLAAQLLCGLLPDDMPEMSASEKIAALFPPMALANPDLTWEENAQASFAATLALRNALPQIVDVIEAAETALERGQQMPVQLSDERGASMGFSTYAAFEMPLAEALAESLVALEQVLDA